MSESLATQISDAPIAQSTLQMIQSAIMELQEENFTPSGVDNSKEPNWEKALDFIFKINGTKKNLAADSLESWGVLALVSKLRMAEGGAEKRERLRFSLPEFGQTNEATDDIFIYEASEEMINGEVHTELIKLINIIRDSLEATYRNNGAVREYKIPEEIRSVLLVSLARLRSIALDIAIKTAKPKPH